MTSGKKRESLYVSVSVLLVSHLCKATFVGIMRWGVGGFRVQAKGGIREGNSKYRQWLLGAALDHFVSIPFIPAGS